jgi:phospholipid/cholesterol/gamma-HCH transport system substrate-binding protein
LETLPGSEPAILRAGPDAGQDMMQAAREALRRLDQVLIDNSGPLRETIGNLKTFTDALARNSARIDSIAQGLDRTFGGAEKPRPRLFDLAPSGKVTLSRAMPAVQIAVTEPTTVLKFDTQRILAPTDIAPEGAFENAQWSDSLPKLLQARIIQSFENAGFGGLAREETGIEADYRLLTDLRSVRLVRAPELRGEVEFGAKLVDRDGRIVGFRIMRAEAASAGTSPAEAAMAINAAFGDSMAALVQWTMETANR